MSHGERRRLPVINGSFLVLFLLYIPGTSDLSTVVCKRASGWENHPKQQKAIHGVLGMIYSWANGKWNDPGWWGRHLIKFRPQDTEQEVVRGTRQARAGRRGQVKLVRKKEPSINRKQPVSSLPLKSQVATSTGPYSQSGGRRQETQDLSPVLNSTLANIWTQVRKMIRL